MLVTYQIWLKGGGTLNGVMAYDDAVRLKDRMRNDHVYPDFSFRDDDGDDVSVRVVDISVFAFRLKPDEPEPIAIGFISSPKWIDPAQYGTWDRGERYGEKIIPPSAPTEVHDSGDEEEVQV